jgi:pilus assembly protein TadC
VDRLVRVVARASRTGAPMAESVRLLAADEAERARWDALERARRAGVQAVGPLAACFLPAFVLLGVVPMIVGVARTVLTGWT